MSNPRPSLFRDALQVSPERIRRLSDFELNELMKDLLCAQAYRCGSPVSRVCVNTEDKARDDGCDAWTERPAKEDPWLGDADTCWQFKAGSAGSPARLKGEVDKRIPRETLRSGGRFVVVASGSTNGRKGVEDRLQVLRAEASAANLPTDRIEVIGSEGLALWCSRNPAAAARWAGRPEGLWTFDDWSGNEVHRVPWQASDAVTEGIVRLRSELDFETGSVQHLHIYGPPGVGKTRFALELCRDAPWVSFVIYFRQASDVRLPELIDGAAAEEDVRLVAVADEVQPEQLLPLRDAIGRASGRIRLITVGHCPTPDPSRIPALAVRPLDREAASKVVNGWHPAMPIEHVDFVVRFADGYMRLLRLAADAVARGAAINVHGLLGREEIRTFLNRMLGPGDRRALSVVAALSSVGWTEGADVEGKAIAAHLKLKWDDVRATVDDFDRRLGIVPRGGRYRYISPIPLGDLLAVEAWETYPDLLSSLPDALPTERAGKAYYKRRNSIGSTPSARERARQQLASFSPLNDFLDEGAARRWSALSPADPCKAAGDVLRALEGSTIEDRLKIKDRARREMVHTLVGLAWPSGTFADATKALALLAEAENESWANNATYEFTGRFLITLGGTSLPYKRRLAVLDDLANKGRTPLTRLVIQALTRAGELRSTRQVLDPLSDELPETEWHPSTTKEYLESVLAALDRLNELAGRSIAELEKDFVASAQSWAMMLRRGPSVREAVARLFDAIRNAYPEAREPLRRIVDDIIYRERKYWNKMPKEEVAALENLHARFEDPSLSARLQQYVGQPRWDRDEQPDLRPLARELIGSPSTLNEMWPWLTSGQALNGWLLGRALAEEDADGLVLGLVQDDERTGPDLRILCGCVSALQERRGNAWYDDWFRSQSRRAPRPLPLLFEIARQCGVTPAVARCLEETLRSEPVGSEIVGQLGFGQWKKELDAETLEALLLAMIKAGHQATALVVLYNRIEALPEEQDGWEELALKLITTGEIIRSYDNMVAYYWKETSLKFIDKHADAIAASIIKEHADCKNSGWVAESSEAAQVLCICAERDPHAVWKTLQAQISTRNNPLFGLGFPCDVLEKIPHDLLLEWVDDHPHPEERASILTGLIKADFSSDETLAARIAGSYGDSKDVARALFSKYESETWEGAASAHWEQLAAALEDAARRTELDKLREWATKASRELKLMAEHYRKDEEEELFSYQ